MLRTLSAASLLCMAQLLASFAFAQVADSDRGGQEPFGPYEPVPGWPKDISTLPGNEGWTWGAVQSIFAESSRL